MKTIGFLLKHEHDILGDLVPYDFAETLVPPPDDELQKVISYLDSGKYVHGLLHVVQDTDGTCIGGYQLLTDGEWIWPGYFSYYLKTGKLKFTDASLYYRMKNRNFQVPEVPEERLKVFAIFFETLLWAKMQQVKNSKKKLQ